MMCRVREMGTIGQQREIVFGGLASSEEAIAESTLTVVEDCPSPPERVED